jgi:hypothetical protein
VRCCIVLCRDVFKSKYLNVLDFVFGNTGVLSGGSVREVQPACDCQPMPTCCITARWHVLCMPACSYSVLYG